MEEKEIEKPQKENIGGREETAYSIYCWIFQLGTWGSLIGAIFGLRNDNKKIFILFGAVYFIYVLIELFSNTSKYLRKKDEQEGLNEIMGRIFKTPPKISLFCECFHTRGSGKRRRKIIKHSETYDIPYYSARDVSGLFTLNGRKEDISRKSFLKLDIEPEICFADEISFQDYMIQKTNFWRANENKDSEFKFEETRIIPDIDNYIFVKLDDDSCFASFWVFLIFTILMFAEIYKLLFNCLCIHLKFKVRKLVSTRYNLNLPKYQPFNPQLDIYEERYTYEEDCYYNNFLDENNIPILPTEEELRMAQQYKDKIPDYKITYEEENVKAGIVIDDPNIKFDPHEEPPKGNIDIILNQNQMNNAGFNQNQMNNAFLNQNQMNTNTNENQYMNSEQLKLNK